MTSCPHPYDLQSFVDGALAAEAAATIRDHLSTCTVCAAHVAEVERLRWLMQARPVEPPVGLAERILDLLGSVVPVRALRCREVGQMVSAYLDDELNELERETLEAHLFACESCYAQYVAMKAAVEAMRDAPPVPVRAGLKERILAAVAADSAEAEGVLGVITPTRRPAFSIETWRRVLAPAAALAAAVLLAIGLFTFRGQQTSSPPDVTVAAITPEVQRNQAEVPLESSPGTAAATPPAVARAPESSETGTTPAAPKEAERPAAWPQRPADALLEEPRMAARPALGPRPRADTPPAAPAPSDLRPAPSRPRPSSHDEAVPIPERAPKVLEPPAVALLPPPTATSVSPRSEPVAPAPRPTQRPGLSTISRTPSRPQQPVIAGSGGRLPAPAPAYASVPATGVTSSRPLGDSGGSGTRLAAAPPLTRPQPRPVSPPKPESSEPLKPPREMIAARGWVPTVPDSRRILHESNGDLSSQLEKRRARLNEEVKAERSMGEPKSWTVEY